jgi:catechol 2,3-dioxygenase-like lactoylglutathione lyase family enzyme
MLVLNHVSIAVPSIDAARSFYDAVMAALGVRKVQAQYHEHYYGAFLLDPAGNRVEAVCHRAEREA